MDGNPKTNETRQPGRKRVRSPRGISASEAWLFTALLSIALVALGRETTYANRPGGASVYVAFPLLLAQGVRAT